ncbi:MAG: hypothetical protein AB1765_06100 [Candidatus Hydrogenedentota bacterium]
MPEQIKKQSKNYLITMINTARAIMILCVIVLIQFQPEKNIISLETLGIIVSVYGILLLILPLDRIRIKLLGFIICLIDIIFILLLITYSGELDSPFFMLLFFPVISLSILYEAKGGLFAVVVFAIYYITFLMIHEYTYEAIGNLLIRMCLLSFFALYLGNVGKEIKGRERIKELEEELKRAETVSK